jgi:hypothetical protein
VGVDHVLQENWFLEATYVVEKNTKLLQNVFFLAKKLSLHIVAISPPVKSFARTINVAAIINVFATTMIVVLCNIK